MSTSAHDGTAALGGITLSLVDFLGALVPGAMWSSVIGVWALALWTGNAADVPRELPATIHAVLLQLATMGTVLQAAVLGVLLCVCIAIGHLAKTFAMEGASVLERLWLASWYVWKPNALPLEVVGKGFMSRFAASWRWSRFPYHVRHARQPYFDELKNIISATPDTRTLEVPGRFPFSYCKRFIRLKAPALWDESVHLEAEVRMLGALFLATLATAATMLALGLAADHPGLLRCCALAVLVGLGFGAAFARHRAREVQYTYMNALLADRELRRHPPSAPPTDAARANARVEVGGL